MKKKKIRKLINELEQLKELSEKRSQAQIDGSQLVSETAKTREAGCVEAYAFCLLRLKQLVED